MRALTTRRLLLACVAAGGVAAPVHAQTGIDALAPGDTVRVRHEVATLLSRGGSVRRSSALRTIEAQLLALRADSIVLATDDGSSALAIADVRELEVRRGSERGSFRRGALWGGIVGALLVGGYATYIASIEPDNPGFGNDSSWVASGAGVGLVLGGLVGGVVNRFREQERWDDVELP